MQFVEVSRMAGIDSFHNVSGGPQKNYILEAKGGGGQLYSIITVTVRRTSS